MDETLQRLRSLARQAAERAYAPYSRFAVGAAVLGEGGRTYSGCNVENASYGLTQCAERSALAHAIAEGARPGSFTLLLLYTPGGRLHPPCGACRQVMHELMAPDSRIVSSCDTEEIREWSRSELLPDPFSREALLAREEP